MKRVRQLMIFLLVIFVVGFIGYLTAGYFIFNTLSPVLPQCGADHVLHVRAYQPDDFTPSYLDNIVEPQAYLMPVFEDVEFPSRDDTHDVTIRAWFVPADSEDVIIIVHGLRSCRQNPEVLLPAGMLHANDYNVLLIDMRNHGESDVVNGRTSVGNTEWRDVLGAYDWLLSQGFTGEHIGLVGISLGGSASINAFTQQPEIRALWVDSTFADINDVLSEELIRNNYPAFLRHAAIFMGRLQGINLTEFSPLESLKKNNVRPVFITHGTADTRLSADYAIDLYNVAGANAQIWIVGGTAHVEAMYRYHEEYSQRLNDFFDASLRQTPHSSS